MKVKKLVQESRVHIGNWNMETLTGKRMGSVLSISYDTQYVSYQLERDMYHILYCTHLYRSIRSRVVQFWLVLRFVLLHCASFSLLEDVTFNISQGPFSLVWHTIYKPLLRQSCFLHSSSLISPLFCLLLFLYYWHDKVFGFLSSFPPLWY